MANLNWLWLPFVPCILALAHFVSKKEGDRRRSVVLSLLLATSAAWMAISGVSAYRNSVSPREFDFQLYWVYGAAIHDGHSPYDADALRQTAELLNPGPDMLAELLFLQTPPSAMLYAPLGAFDIQTACVLWYAFQAAVITGVVVLLSRMFLSKEGLLGVALYDSAAVFAAGAGHDLAGSDKLSDSPGSTFVLGIANEIPGRICVRDWNPDQANSGSVSHLPVSHAAVETFLRSRRGGRNR